MENISELSNNIFETNLLKLKKAIERLTNSWFKQDEILEKIRKVTFPNFREKFEDYYGLENTMIVWYMISIALPLAIVLVDYVCLSPIGGYIANSWHLTSIGSTILTKIIVAVLYLIVEIVMTFLVITISERRLEGNSVHWMVRMLTYIIAICLLCAPAAIYYNTRMASVKLAGEDGLFVSNQQLVTYVFCFTSTVLHFVGILAYKYTIKGIGYIIFKYAEGKLNRRESIATKIKADVEKTLTASYPDFDNKFYKYQHSSKNIDESNSFLLSKQAEELRRKLSEKKNDKLTDFESLKVNHEIFSSNGHHVEEPVK